MTVYKIIIHIITDAVKTSHLNHLAIEDIVIEGDLQSLQSHKIFSNDVLTRGDINIDLLNNINLTVIYHNSVLSTQNNAIKGDIKMKLNTNYISNLNVQTLNKVPIDRLNYILNFHDPEIVATSAGNTIQKIGNIVEKSLKNLQRKY